MKAHLKTTASVLVVLAVGALVLSEVPALHGQSSGSTKLSCSSPEVIDTFRVMALRRSQNPDRDVSITNIGTLGLLGNEILCSGDLNGAPGTYSLLPLDDGRFKVTITSILGHYNYSGLSFYEIGPVNYLDEKQKLLKSKQPASIEMEERERDLENFRQQEDRREKAANALKNPYYANTCAASSEPIEECIQKYLNVENLDPERRRRQETDREIERQKLEKQRKTK